MKLNKVLFRFVKIAFSLVILLFIIYAAGKIATTAYDFGYRVFTEEAVDQAPGTDVKVQIKDEMTSKDIGQLLEDKGLVADGKLFQLQYRLSAYYKEIKPGIYTLNTSMTAKEMMILMAEEEEVETEDTEELVESETTEASTASTEQAAE